jgi:hypothetical protein
MKARLTRSRSAHHHKKRRSLTKQADQTVANSVGTTHHHQTWLDQTGLTDASLLTLLADEQMPHSSRTLAAGLALRQPYKVVLEISRMAGRLFNRLDALFWHSERRHHIEKMLATELAPQLQTEIADYEVLFDIPRPEKWEMDVWISVILQPIVAKMSEISFTEGIWIISSKERSMRHEWCALIVASWSILTQDPTWATYCCTR